jgi:hypothetical protein
MKRTAGPTVGVLTLLAASAAGGRANPGSGASPSPAGADAE